MTNIIIIPGKHNQTCSFDREHDFQFRIPSGMKHQEGERVPQGKKTRDGGKLLDPLQARIPQIMTSGWPACFFFVHHSIPAYPALSFPKRIRNPVNANPNGPASFRRSAVKPARGVFKKYV
jgi:hypothetical protein